VNIKIAGKWMFIPLKMVLISIDPYPDVVRTVLFVTGTLQEKDSKSKKGGSSRPTILIGGCHPTSTRYTIHSKYDRLPKHPSIFHQFSINFYPSIH
jgi:hypothetical protein